MRPEVLQMLRCPEDKSALTAASSAIIDEVNAAIRADRLVNRAGKRVERILNGGLLRTAGDVLYPIIDQIPVLLRDEAIELHQVGKPRVSS